MQQLPGTGLDPELDGYLADYTGTGSRAALERAVTRARQLAAAAGDAQLMAPVTLVSLLIARGQRSSAPDDFTEALDRLGELRATAPTLRDLEPALLLMECAALSERAGRTGSTSDLERVIAIGPAAPRSDPATLAGIDNYRGAALLARFQLRRQSEDLEQAAMALRRGRESAHEPLLRAALANNLAVALHESYQTTASDEDLHQALDLTLITRRELETCGLPPGLTADARFAADITRASLLATRWRFRSDPADLSEARAAFERVLKQLPDNHALLSGAAAAYGSLATDMALARRSVKAANTAVRLYRSAATVAATGTSAHSAATTSLVVALQARWELTSAPADLEEAITLQRQVKALPQLSAHEALFDHNLGVLLASRYAASSLPEDLDESISCHERALRSALRNGVDGDLMEIRCAYSHVQRYVLTGDRRDRDRAIELLKQTAERSGVTIRRVEGLRLLAEIAELTQDYQLAERAAHRTLKLVESVIGALDLHRWGDWLMPMQGLATVGALAAIRLQHYSRAVSFIERSCAVRASARLAQQSATLQAARFAGHRQEVDAYTQAAERVRRLLSRDATQATILSVQPTMSGLPGAGAHSALVLAIQQLHDTRQALETKVGSLLAGGTVEQLLEFVQSENSPLDYLIAGAQTGARLRLAPDPSGPTITAQWLPDFTSATVDRLVQELYAPDVIASHDRPIEGTRGQSEGPSVDAIQDVVSHLAGIIGKAADTADVKVVAVGKAALLPLTPALASGDHQAVGIAIAGSGQLHRMAAGRSKHQKIGRPPRIIAITNPQPCTWERLQWPSLPGASEEGLMLEQDYGARAYSGAAATADALVRAFQDPSVDVVHVAAHGSTATDDEDLVRILLANDSRGIATTVSEHDLPPVLTSKVVFLAACWTGRNLAALPDEATGFTTWLLQAGASAAVAPLWPVDDEATLQFVEAFYRHWVSNPDSAPIAAARARADLISWAQRSTAASQERRDAAISSAYAFVVAGA